MGREAAALALDLALDLALSFERGQKQQVKGKVKVKGKGARLAPRRELSREVVPRKMSDSPTSVDDLLRATRRQLDELYASRDAGTIPQGDSCGTALALPGTPVTQPVSRLARPLWQGKVFDPATSTLINKVLGLRLFVAKVYRGESWFDGKPAIIVDYQETSLLVAPIRDEIREISPGVYLGMAYLRSKGRMRLIHFALDLTGKTEGLGWNRAVLLKLTLVLLAAGILGFVVPPEKNFTSGAVPYNVFHLVFGAVGGWIALWGSRRSARVFNVGFGVIDLYQALASAKGLFPAALFLWKPADDVIHWILGGALVLVGLLCDRRKA
ncbi:MAG: hypothetical protein HYY18_11490 [Planctomycetes bacterium]|nr:hypothetical protein [Planctomycetota bacterium]